MFIMITPYEKYLSIIGYYIDKYFQDQAPYICCKEGCSHCCETGEYPYTHLEFEYLMFGYKNLNDKQKEIIQEKVKKIKEEQQAAKKEDKKFMYECPFLINKSCSVYDYRGIICRSHGLMTFFCDENGKENYQIPYCVHFGLNYSEVFDAEKDTISKEKWHKSGIEVEPNSYNLGLKYLLDNEISYGLNLNFGKQKSLIDWFQD